MTSALTDTALGWVRADLDKLLEQLRLQVENLANNRMAGDAAIDGTRGTAQQLMLTFDTLNLDGARQVMAEVTALLGQLGDRVGDDRQRPTELMMDAMVVLPAYLDRLQAGHPDLPVLLLPLINDMREAAGEEALTEGTLFAPLLDVELPELEIVRRPGYDEPFDYFSNRMLRQFEKALGLWLQDQNDASLLPPLHGICETLRHRLQRYSLKRLWWVATEVTSGLMDGHVNNDVQLRRLLARLQLLLQKTAEGGEDAIAENNVTSVTQALLFHVGKARSGHAGLDLVSERFELVRLMPDRDALMRAQGTLAGRDRDMYQSLSAAVSDELALVKDALDLELRTGQVDADSRDQITEALQRLVDTLGMLGLSAPAEAIAGELAAFDDSVSLDNEQREPVLVRLAERLLLVESSLREQIETLGEAVDDEGKTSYIDLPVFEQSRIRSQVLDEAVVSIHAAQEGLRQYLSGDPEADAVGPLEQVTGALDMIGLEDIAADSADLQSLLETMTTSGRHAVAIEGERLDALADALAALELFLAGQRDRQAGHQRFRNILTERVKALQEGLADTGTETSPAPIAAPPPAEPEPPSAPAVEAPTPAESETTTPETVPVPAVASGEDELPPQIDPELREIFLEEYESVLEDLQLAIPTWMTALDDAGPLTEIRRAFHTLKGSGRMVGAEELGDFAWQIEDMLNALLEGRTENFGDISVMVRLAQASLPSLRQRLLQETSGLKRGVIELIGRQAQGLGQGAQADWESLRRLLPAYLAGMLPGGLEEVGLYDTEAGGEDDEASMLRQELEVNLAPVQALLDAVSKDRGTRADAEQLRAIHSIAGALAMHPEGRDANIAKALESLFTAQAHSGRRFSAEAMWTLVSAVGHIQSRLDRLKGQSDTAPPGDELDLLAHLKQLAEELSGPADGGAPDLMAEAESALEESLLAPAEPGLGESDPAAETGFDPGHSVFAGAADLDEPDAPVAPPPTPAAPEPAPPPVAELDPDITQIFLEEAQEVLARSDGLLNQWRDDVAQLRWVQNLQREIHTFKGGARMAGLTALGEFSHAMETLLERIAEKRLPPSVSAVQVLEDACDRLQGWVERVAGGEIPDSASAQTLLEQQIDALEGVSVPPEEVAAPTPESKPVQAIPESEAPAPEPTAERGGPQQIRVAADLLDKLVNAAGEVSIFRSRLEQQVGGVRENLSEFDETIGRLREQFRKLDIEIEAQIRSNYPEASSNGQGFDPLELDEFSTLHQLSRSLSESVADLMNLQEMLEENTRKAEKLLTQQSRVSTELQEGLMQTRMVPFGSIAPRLRRLVRSAGKETGKQARLQLQMVGTSDDLDRNVLETITAPLEHMMRNAVAHGIESPDDRQAAGKAPEGEITITVESEATEFVIRIQDDGAGIDTDAIHRKAVERGLLDDGAEPPRQQLYEFMMDSGFSTTQEVTRLAGRGVGMDVVNSEIKQIGGSLEIDSVRGKGSLFTIRIPFTLAVMQAIGLVAGDNRYLLPLSSVVGVARMLPEDYTALAEQDNPHYTFAGQDYPVLDIEPLLGERSKPLGRDNVSLLIVSAGDHRAALRVPDLLPHREVVIKPVGPQVSCVPGILGGSISANGEVVVILDPGPMIRHALIHGIRAVPAEERLQVESNQALVMVVDDSITMRKVTSRVLESHDYEVITARDGVEATELLQDRIPDLMLLDIEMPRMDGYELTEFVRDDSRLRNIPIMMITSRAGQKHRERAEQAGANAYMTKPYSETELVTEVHRLLNGAMAMEG